MEWFKHPVYDLYAHRDGTVRGTRKGKCGSLGSDGYIHVCCRGLHLRAHRIIWECVHATVLDPKQYIDHIDGVKHNNQLQNLQLLSHQEHALKTRKDNPQMTAKAAATRVRPVIRTCVRTQEEVTFVSQWAAQKSTPGSFQQHIIQMCSRGAEDALWLHVEMWQTRSGR